MFSTVTFFMLTISCSYNVHTWARSPGEKVQLHPTAVPYSFPKGLQVSQLWDMWHTGITLNRLIKLHTDIMTMLRVPPL